MNREQIERLVERLRSYAQNNEMIDQHYTESGRAMNEAADALEGLASDAVRYRWLRDADNWIEVQPMLDQPLQFDELDKRIDECMADDAAET
jgi:hypothetical protein